MDLVIQDRYYLLRLLGRGGMGVVYLAWDAVLERYVAVKRVRGPAEGIIDSGESWRALREEAQLVARFRHPGIVSVFDFGAVGPGGNYASPVSFVAPAFRFVSDRLRYRGVS